MIVRSKAQSGSGIRSSEGAMNVAGIRGCAAIVALALTCASPACGGPRPLELPGPGGRGGIPREGTTTRAGPKDIRLDVKRVSGKEPPTTLIAEDGTRCIVTEGRYREAKIGSDAWCAWRAP
jgi:hypothetical protein